MDLCKEEGTSVLPLLVGRKRARCRRILSSDRRRSDITFQHQVTGTLIENGESNGYFHFYDSRRLSWLGLPNGSPNTLNCQLRSANTRSTLRTPSAIGPSRGVTTASGTLWYQRRQSMIDERRASKVEAQRQYLASMEITAIDNV